MDLGRVPSLGEFISVLAKFVIRRFDVSRLFNGSLLLFHMNLNSPMGSSLFDLLHSKFRLFLLVDKLHSCGEMDDPVAGAHAILTPFHPVFCIS